MSRDLKNTLDNELGIDEIRRDLASAQVSRTAPEHPFSYSVGQRRGAEVYLRKKVSAEWLAHGIPESIPIAAK